MNTTGWLKGLQSPRTVPGSCRMRGWRCCGRRSEIFYTSDEQRQVAEDTLAAADASGTWPGKVVTKISEAGPFWEAEAEDQDYLQHYPDGKNQFSP